MLGSRFRIGRSGLGRFIRRPKDGRRSLVNRRGGRIEKSRVRKDLGVLVGIGIEGEVRGRFGRAMDRDQDGGLALGAEGGLQVDRIFA